MSPSVGSAGNSAIVIAMAVSGGVGTIWGPFLGGLLLYGLTEALRFVGVVYILIAVGGVMIVFVIFAPKGWPGCDCRPAGARYEPMLRTPSGAKTLHKG